MTPELETAADELKRIYQGRQNLAKEDFHWQTLVSRENDCWNDLIAAAGTE